MPDPPAITLTVTDPDTGGLSQRNAHAPPAAPASPGARNDSSSAWPSPARLIKTLSHSNNTNTASSTPASPASSPTNGAPREDANGKHDARPPSAIDPLSQHILSRTGAPLSPPTSAATRPRTPDGNAVKDGEPQQQPTPSQQQQQQQQQQEQAGERSPSPSRLEPLSRTDTGDNGVSNAHRDLKKGVKAVSFLSRLMGTAKRREHADEDVAADDDDDESAASGGRPEGNDVEVYAQKMDNMGFRPRHPQPPAYIKVRARFKKQRDLDRLFLAQELQGSSATDADPTPSASAKLRRKVSATSSEPATVWAMEFSKDGRYLAAAGADAAVRVWAVLSSREERQTHETQESRACEARGLDTAHAEHLSAPVFRSRPVREYEGHTAAVLDLSWSKNNFLLSSSMDRAVRLWHVSRPECLCTFKHNDLVPSVAFHPRDDRFFLAGSLDSKLRLWSIPDKSVAYAAQVPDMITAVAFTPDGRSAIAGCLSGLCTFYETEGLRYQTQLHVRSTRGANAKGSKITGIEARSGLAGDVRLLITSNDSRIRLYHFRDKSLELKFRGLENASSQIRAAWSDDGRYVICGSEDRKAYLWSPQQLAHGERRDRTPVEMFEAHDAATTVARIAPALTRQHLGRSDDPVYDLCNPPPVTLLSNAERAGSSSRASSPRPAEQPRESAAYLARSSHPAGHILVTTDSTGRIKVFRQDCAWSKRTRDDTDRASLFARRAAGGRLSRTASVATRASQRSGTGTIDADRTVSWRQAASAPAHAPAPASSSSARSHSASPRATSPEPGQAAPRQAPDPADEPTNAADALSLQGERSYMYWDPKPWRERAERMHRMTESHQNNPQHNNNNNNHPDSTTHPSPPSQLAAGPDPGLLSVSRPRLSPSDSLVSELSDERSSADDEHFSDAREDETTRAEESSDGHRPHHDHHHATKWDGRDGRRRFGRGDVE